MSYSECPMIRVSPRGHANTVSMNDLAKPTLALKRWRRSAMSQRPPRPNQLPPDLPSGSLRRLRRLRPLSSHQHRNGNAVSQAGRGGRRRSRADAAKPTSWPELVESESFQSEVAKLVNLAVFSEYLDHVSKSDLQKHNLIRANLEAFAALLPEQEE